MSNLLKKKLKNLGARAAEFHMAAISLEEALHTARKGGFMPPDMDTRLAHIKGLIEQLIELVNDEVEVEPTSNRFQVTSSVTVNPPYEIPVEISPDPFVEYLNADFPKPGDTKCPPNA